MAYILFFDKFSIEIFNNWEKVKNKKRVKIKGYIDNTITYYQLFKYKNNLFALDRDKIVKKNDITNFVLLKT
jgi:hypothetical protein